MAHSSFQRLAASLQTMVTIGVYDLETADPYLPDLSQRYQEHLKTIPTVPDYLSLGRGLCHKKVLTYISRHLLLAGRSE